MEPRGSLLATIVVLFSLAEPWGSTSPPASPSSRLWCGPHGPAGQTEVERVETGQRLEDLRAQMMKVDAVHGPALQAFIVTSHDEHQSEYVAEHDRRREFITGFTGSNGVAVVTENHAALWTDGRYYVQADRELGCEWILMRDGRPEVPTMSAWLQQTVGSGSRVGADARLVPHFNWVEWREELAGANITLVAVSKNLVDLIWTVGRSNYSAIPAYPQLLKYAGKEWPEKVEDMREKMMQLGADAMVVTALDDVAWLLNIRGRDIPFVPVVRAYVILTANAVHAYAPFGKLNKTLSMMIHLRSKACYGRHCVRIHDYNQIWDDLRTFSQVWHKVILPSPYSYSAGASHAIYNAVPEGKHMPIPSIVMTAKAQKNAVEREGMRKAHIRDAVALCDFFAYLESQVASGTLDEAAVADAADGFRMEQEESGGASFETIAGFGPNGAQPHYTPPRNRGTLSAPGVWGKEALVSGGLKIDNSSTLVIDSGGQYYDGTTDVTRTLHFGTPTALQREAYTRVLSGHLNLAALVFPEANTEVVDVDVVARAPLWSVGLDFRHGTGHGVGSFLSVHEAPISVSYYGDATTKFKEGYFFSDEPGYYHEGEFGIRLENVLEVVKVETKYKFDGPYLGFSSVTLVPYEPKLIDLDLLSNEQRRMLNDYNARVRTEVGAELKRQKRMRGFYWMMSKTLHVPECKTSKVTHSSKSRMTSVAQRAGLHALCAVVVVTAAAWSQRW
ncbi:xaa-Pro aminopeptidase 1-like [Hetaerina americana]|uniref:xaa-Pro aminopeptidase 1-like n=1 Tax=Hetaerina americana TaxID=62018 RepID=UPI003A7F1F64